MKLADELTIVRCRHGFGIDGDSPKETYVFSSLWELSYFLTENWEKKDENTEQPELDLTGNVGRGNEPRTGINRGHE